jgi:aminopeptidase N
MLATNEQRYPWMDEGFTNFADNEAMNFIFNEGKVNPHIRYVKVYKELDSMGLLEPMATPADRFTYNYQYSIHSYYMGQLMLMQLQYILGEDAFWRGMKAYYNRWAFKHPRPEDFIKVMEDVSGLQLDWFLVGWTQLTHTTDYAVQGVESAGPSGSKVILVNKGKRQMPVDVKISLKGGSEMYFTIPVLDMYGAKTDSQYLTQAPWRWVDKNYELNIPVNVKDIKMVEIDPLVRSCDVAPANNVWKAK